MSKLPTIKTILSGFFSTAALNANFVALRDAFNNTLSRDGSTPNTMSADIDLNGNDLLNVGTLTAQDLTVAGVDLTFQESIAEVNLKADEAAASALSAANSAAAAQAAENSLLEWAGPWLTATTYAPSDLVQEDGSTYVCVIAHTSGTFATDYGAGKWELFASKGSAGAGAGDMLAANNLSDLANADTALTNLGGTVVGKAVFKATDTAAGQTALGLGSLATKNEVTASEIAAATLVTTTDTIASNNNDTTIPTSAAVKAYTDGAVAAVPTGGMTLLGTLTTTSGTAQTLSGLTLTDYKALYIVIRGVSFDTTSRKLQINGATCSIGLSAASDTLFGLIQVSLENGVGTSYVAIVNTNPGSASSAGAGFALRTGYTTASTSISFNLDGAGNFDNGTILVYGVK